MPGPANVRAYTHARQLQRAGARANAPARRVAHFPLAVHHPSRSKRSGIRSLRNPRTKLTSTTFMHNALHHDAPMHAPKHARTGH
jgi:hypothetical protein